MHAIKHTCTQTPLKVSPLGCLNKWAMVCMLGILAKQNKTKDLSPSMTLSKGCLNKDDFSPSKC